MTLPIAQTAANEYRRRAAKARQVIWERSMTVEGATEHLRPWLAIACLCGADLPELAEGIADLRTTFLDPIAGEARNVSETEARAQLAHEICPRGRWIGVLAKARDAAIRKAEATLNAAPGSAKAREYAEARAMVRLASALAIDPQGKHHLPLYRPTDHEIRRAA